MSGPVVDLRGGDIDCCEELRLPLSVIHAVKGIAYATRKIQRCDKSTGVGTLHK